MEIIKKHHMVLFFIIIFLFYSCATEKPIYGIPISSKELETINVLGIVETEYNATRYYGEKELLEKGYEELLIIAKKRFVGNVDVKNIVLEKRNSNKNLWYLLVQVYTVHYITVRAKGLVIEVEK